MDEIIVGIVRDEEGEWVQVFVNDQLRYENHSIPVRIWMELLEEAGAIVTEDWKDFRGE